MRPIEYIRPAPAEGERLEEVIELAKAQIEQSIRHIVQKFGGFKLVVEDGPRRADDEIGGVPLERGDAIRITIRPKFHESK